MRQKMMSKTMGAIQRYLRDDRGSVAIEAGLYFVVFFLLCALLVDFSDVFLNKSYLERVTHSLASVVRERSAFYGEKEELSQQEVSDLYELAGVLLEESRLAGSRYQLVVEAVFFQPSGSKAQKNVLNTQSLSQGTGSCRSRLAITSTQIADLSPWDTKGRWLPVYQVTICLPGGESMFKRALNSVGIEIGDIAISNAVIPR
ncbi:tight adherence pilus pseudopilin TadF [Raoultella sp. YJ]|uniref:tight adherence pilus pseudopilin TadF n=1 Tax=Raoultella sp. YJ TaxID=1850565 RepID=UPI0011132C8C|nr:tight adherence pilus pseudopilin TadF [Raoultella sp. YJ]